MAVLPEIVIKECQNYVGSIVFSTVNNNGILNAIYAACVVLYNPETIVITDNRFEKTRNNILSGSKGSILFLTEEKKSFQIKRSIEYHKTGEIFDDIKKWNPDKLPGHAAAALKVE